ncbi:hypothetical protein [Sphingobacterium sp. IITKGP-BTPF85]|uniref:hypothetical protein n=1 Tax=Sphingobacterium sp. IITKGP-BTPF85 TaxID=1338009 RepID=UPI00041AD183|nr:hypothetical protein [Sphingobacterium sp. IITKGP-BTPF85]KKX50102.1 hypothetical protein L950_0212245 [Sphingobacterium sp. IITKGP-BTPF85]
MFEPAIENILDIETAYDRPLYAQGLLLNGYNRVPTNSWSFNDVATDDAVTNERINDYQKFLQGNGLQSTIRLINGGIANQQYSISTTF